MQWFRKALAFFFLVIMNSMIMHAAIPHLDAHHSSSGERIHSESAHFHIGIASHDHGDNGCSEDFDLIDFLLNLHTHSDYSHTEYSFLTVKSLKSVDQQDQGFTAITPSIPRLNNPVDGVIPPVSRTITICLSSRIYTSGLRAPPGGFLAVSK